jgi:hypothetical protein
MKKQMIFLLIMVFATIQINAQQWVQMKNEGKSLTEIQTAMKIRFKGKTTIKGRENFSPLLKQYKRWEFYWRTNVDADGRFPSNKTIYNSFLEMEKVKKASESKSANWSYVGPIHLPQAVYPDWQEKECRHPVQEGG